MIFFFFFLMIRRPPSSTRTDTLFPYTTLFRSMLSGSVAELYPREKIIPTTETDRLLMLEPTFIRHNGEVMLLDLGGKSHDPNPKRKGGYTESTFEQAYMDGLIDRKSTRLNSSH